MLDVCTRDILNVTAPRAMAALNPLKINITNFPYDHPRSVKVPNFPANESKGFHNVDFTEIIYIDRDDFQEVNSLTNSKHPNEIFFYNR